MNYPYEKIGQIEEVVYSRIDKIRLGIYREDQDGSLRDVLEELERILQND